LKLGGEDLERGESKAAGEENASTTAEKKDHAKAPTEKRMQRQKKGAERIGASNDGHKRPE